jgi:hypothetical protein
MVIRPSEHRARPAQRSPAPVRHAGGLFQWRPKAGITAGRLPDRNILNAKQSPVSQGGSLTELPLFLNEQVGMECHQDKDYVTFTLFVTQHSSNLLVAFYLTITTLFMRGRFCDF